MVFFKSLTAAAITFAMLSGSQVDAHMVMKTPVPYGKDTLNNSPLDKSGSDYPCKLRSGAFTVSEVNKMAVGQSQTLSFTGSASHGGGSCQLSITTDKEPNAASKFRVIHSIIGGCPSAGDGNSGSTTFQFQIPSAVPNGQATLAWTWINKIGNREFYMNCAPVEISGGAANTAEFEKLPELYVANIAISPNQVPEGTEVEYPNPGNSVFRGRGGSAPAPVSAPNQAPSSVSNVQPSSSFASVKPSSTQTSAVQPLSSQASHPETPVTLTTFITVIASTKPSAAPLATNPPTPASGPTSQDCTTHGAVVCNADGTQFGLCNNGKVQMQSVAPGTKCVAGAIEKSSA